MPVELSRDLVEPPKGLFGPIWPLFGTLGLPEHMISRNTSQWDLLLAIGTKSSLLELSRDLGGPKKGSFEAKICPFWALNSIFRGTILFLVPPWLDTKKTYFLLIRLHSEHLGGCQAPFLVEKSSFFTLHLYNLDLMEAFRPHILR